VVVLAFVGVLLHNGVAYQDPGLSGIAAAGMLLLVQSLGVLVFGALVAERRHAEDWLRRSNQTLEAKVAERTRQLAQSEARLKLMADASPFPLVMSHLDGGALIYANAKACSSASSMTQGAGYRISILIRKRASGCRACCMARGRCAIMKFACTTRMVVSSGH
jgi:hypothetical protein